METKKGSVPVESNPIKEQMRDRLKSILAEKQAADEAPSRKVAKKSMDERAPDFPDVPLTPEEKAKMDQPKEKPSDVALKPEPAPSEPEASTKRYSPEDVRQRVKAIRRGETRVESKTEPKPEPAVEEAKPEEKPAAPPSASDQQKYKYEQGDEFLALSKDWQGKTEREKIAEVDLDDSLKAMRDEVNNFGEKYAKIVGEVEARQSVIKKLTGKNPEKYQESQGAIAEWKQKQEEFGRAFYKNIQDRLKSGEIIPEYADEQTKNFEIIMANHVLDVHGRKFDFKKDFSEEKNWLSSSVAKGYNAFIGKFRKMPFAIKAPLGVGIFLAGNVAAIAGWRIVGGLAAGKGSHEGLQAVAEWWRQRKERKDIQRFEKDLERRELSVEDKIKLRLGRYERQNNNLERKMTKYARGDYYRKFASVLLAITVGSGTVARFIQSTGLGGAIKEKLFGGGTAGGGTQSLYTEGKYGPEGYGTEAEGHIPESQPEAGGGAGKTYAEGYSGTEGTGHRMDFKEIASGKVGEGGSIEKISNNVLQEIKKDPAAYGLDPNDPNLSAKAEGLRKGMIEEFFKKKGFDTYEEFDKYVRRGPVQANDKFWVNWDPNEGKFRFGYEGENMRPDLIQIISGDEVAGSKAGVAPEEMKPKAGAGVAEQPSSRARGAEKMKFSPEIEEMDRVAQENTAKANQYAEDVAKWKTEAGVFNEQQLKVANLQQVLSTRGLVNNIVEDAGIGKRASFWGQPMSKFNDLVGENLFAGEAGEPNAVSEINSNKDKLRRLFEILKEYSVHGGETMDECLRKAITNPTPIRGGKLGESVGSRVLQLINQKILGK